MHFSRIFPIILQIFINFNANFLKFPTILGPCPMVKFLFTPEKLYPPNIWRTPLNRKIQHKLLIYTFIYLKQHHHSCSKYLDDKFSGKNTKIRSKRLAILQFFTFISAQNALSLLFFGKRLRNIIFPGFGAHVGFEPKFGVWKIRGSSF